MRHRALIHLVAQLIPALASAASITVLRDGTGDYSTIQPALDAAADGDTILIGPGEYLEHATMRLPQWSLDVESYANVTVDDLTIIGAGANETIIGPVEAAGVYDAGPAKLITYNGGGDLAVSGVCLRNGSHGMYVAGRLFLDQCSFVGNLIPLEWMTSGGGGRIRDCRFEEDGTWQPTHISIRSIVSSTDVGILVEDCTAKRVAFFVIGITGVTLRRCAMAGASTSVGVYGGAQICIDSCTINDTSVAVDVRHGLHNQCTIIDSDLSASWATLWVAARYGRVVVSNSSLGGGSGPVLKSDSEAGSSQINGCDLVKGSGPMVECVNSGLGTAVHDLRNNYWGTTDEATIRSWIIEANRQTVLHSPFAGQSVPTETTTWGDLKALYR
jgi:hypothetical protein